MQILGEIIAPQQMLRKGAILAVSTVTVLYIFVAAAYYAACDYAKITSEDTDLGMAVLFGPMVRHCCNIYWSKAKHTGFWAKFGIENIHSSICCWQSGCCHLY
jgi:hypothetical protein